LIDCHVKPSVEVLTACRAAPPAAERPGGSLAAGARSGHSRASQEGPLHQFDCRPSGMSPLSSPAPPSHTAPRAWPRNKRRLTD